MKFYVASRFDRYWTTREVIDTLRRLGHQVTYDWTRSKEFGDDGYPLPHANSNRGRDLPWLEQQGYAANDLRGIQLADIVILLAEDDLTGAMVEVGAALAWGKEVWVVQVSKWTIFYSLPGVHLLPDIASIWERV